MENKTKATYPESLGRKNPYSYKRTFFGSDHTPMQLAQKDKFFECIFHRWYTFCALFETTRLWADSPDAKLYSDRDRVFKILKLLSDDALETAEVIEELKKVKDPLFKAAFKQLYQMEYDQEPDEEEPKQENKLAAQSEIIDFGMSTEFDEISCGNEQMKIMGSLKAKDFKARNPVDIIVVVDRSGSMSGAKMDLTKRTLEFLVEQLSSTDTLCLISFETDVKIELETCPMTFENIKKAKQLISALSVTGGTNLCGGLSEGVKQIKKINSPNLKSLLLLTDGEATDGIKEEKEILQTLSKELKNVDCSIYTFGYGEDHQENLLSAIAKRTNGMYYFLKTVNDIMASFGECLGGLISTVATSIAVTISIAEGCDVKRVLGKQDCDVIGNSYTFSIKDISAEEERDILLELDLPAIQTPTEVFKIGHYSLKYKDPINGKVVSLGEKKFFVRRVQTPKKKENIKVNIQLNRLTAAAALDAAQIKGDITTAGTTLQKAITSIENSPSASDPFVVELLKQLREVKDSLATESSHSVSFKNIVTIAQSHNTQRSSGSRFYATSSKKKMTEESLQQIKVEQSKIKLEEFLSVETVKIDPKDLAIKRLHMNAKKSFHSPPVRFPKKEDTISEAAVYSKYEKKHSLGSGGGAEVFLAIELSSRKQVAVKEVKILGDSKALMYAEREIDSLLKCNHKNIIKLLNHFQTAEKAYLILEFMDQQLRSVMNSRRTMGNPKFSEIYTRNLIRQLLEAIKYIHSLRIMHRDVKPENIYIMNDGTLKLADFEFAKEASNEPEKHALWGTKAYSAPEVIEGIPFTPIVDEWAVGVITYEMLSGIYPFPSLYSKNEAKLEYEIAFMQYDFKPKDWEGISEDAKIFVKNLMCDSNKRITAAQALNHSWIKEK